MPPPPLDRFREYLRLRTDHPSPSAGYAAAGRLFEELAAEAGLGFETLTFVAGHPLYLLTLPGADAAAPSIVLLSHMDVVPVDAAKWTRDPWAGELATVDGEARVYGRGAQDMKSVSVQQVAALARLRARGFAPRRSIHVLLVPDEEVGGSRGIKPFLGSEKVRALNVGFVLDEGLASPDPARFSVFYGERKIWWVRLRARGPAGHGSRFVPHTAVAQLTRGIARIADFHDAQAAELAATCGCGKQLGDFVTANVTMLRAGNADAATPQYNVIPTDAEAGVDIRIPATVDLEDFKKTLDAWCAVEGGGVEWEPLPAVCGEGAMMTSNPTTPVAGPDARWFGVFSAALSDAGFETHAPSIFPAATDSRWVRLLLGAPCLGFSPMRGTPILLHDHDEFVSVRAFEEGIDVYEALIQRLADDAGA
jgi:N-acyl-L-amino-acid amidohydrolase